MVTVDAKGPSLTTHVKIHPVPAVAPQLEIESPRPGENVVRDNNGCIQVELKVTPADANIIRKAQFFIDRNGRSLISRQKQVIGFDHVVFEVRLPASFGEHLLRARLEAGVEDYVPIDIVEQSIKVKLEKLTDGGVERFVQDPEIAPEFAAKGSSVTAKGIIEWAGPQDEDRDVILKFWVNPFLQTVVSVHREKGKPTTPFETPDPLILGQDENVLRIEVVGAAANGPRYLVRCASPDTKWELHLLIVTLDEPGTLLKDIQDALGIERGKGNSLFDLPDAPQLTAADPWKINTELHRFRNIARRPNRRNCVFLFYYQGCEKARDESLVLGTNEGSMGPEITERLLEASFNGLVGGAPGLSRRQGRSGHLEMGCACNPGLGPQHQEHQQKKRARGLHGPDQATTSAKTSLSNRS